LRFRATFTRLSSSSDARSGGTTPLQPGTVRAEKTGVSVAGAMNQRRHVKKKHGEEDQG
jgi:hypothetical protein